MVGQNIREARKKLRMSQRELAKLVGKSAATVCQWETGQRGIDVEVIPDLARILQVPAASLIGVDDDAWPTMVEEIKWARATTPNEQRLLKAYRNADPIYQSVALELLETHQK